eukprot:11668572-Alexandrium_andersonii.AAC.1
MPDASMAHASMVAGQSGRASWSRAPACAVSQCAQRRGATGAFSTPRSRRAHAAACKLASGGAGGDSSGAARPHK